MEQHIRTPSPAHCHSERCGRQYQIDEKGFGAHQATRGSIQGPTPSSCREGGRCDRQCQSEALNSHMNLAIQGFDHTSLQGAACLSQRTFGYLSQAPAEDIEKAGLTRFEHVTVKLKGSNCPGCTGHISKALASIHEVHHLRFNPVLLQAEFDFDAGRTPLRGLLEKLQKRTGRACELMGDDWLEIEIEVEGGFLSEDVLPVGVKDIQYLRKKLWRIKYDPHSIGARDMLHALEQSNTVQIYLAPRRSTHETPKSIFAMAWKTAFAGVLTVPILIFAWAPIPGRGIGYDVGSLVLASIIQAVIVGPFYPKIVRTFLASRTVNMDLLVVLSTTIAYLFAVATFICQVLGTKLGSQLNFETSALLITLIMLGRLMSDFACHRSLHAQSIDSLQPQTATLISNNGGVRKLKSMGIHEMEVDTRLLQKDDYFVVRANGAVATDGVITSGTSEFDESLISGEARLVEKEAGSDVVAGSRNHGSSVIVKVARLPGENTLDKMSSLVQEVLQSKPKVQQVADRMATWFIGVIGTLAMITFIVWIAVGTWALGLSSGSAILKAMPYSISVLVVSCPCAIGLAVPIVLIIVSRIGAKHGIVVRSPEALIAARNITHVVFDKTGTLTDGNLRVTSEEYRNEQTREADAALAMSLALASSHPVSSSLRNHLEVMQTPCCRLSNVRVSDGKGVKGCCHGQDIRLGSARWLGVEDDERIQDLVRSEMTVVCVMRDGKLVAIYGLRSTLREDARRVTAALLGRGISVSIISGDETGAVGRAGKELGISGANIRARCSPRDKQEYVKEIKKRERGAVIFCGDGMNDAAALAQATVGVHMQNGLDFAQSTADIVLTQSKLSSLLVLMEMSRRSYQQIVFNFTWAALYNMFAILFAAGAFVKIYLPPQYAGLGEAFSVLPVILVPFQLEWRRYM